MKQLNNVQSAIFLIGGVLMVIGAGCFATMWNQKAVCWIYLIGALMFAWIQISQTYEGTSTVIHRLKKIMTTADIFFVLSGMLMVDSAYKYMQNICNNYITYVEYIYNKWVLLLLVAALLEIYTMHRISSELRKEEQHQKKS